jgi:hypothetical protein
VGVTVGGFEAPGTGLILDFAGTEFDGLEITVDSVSLGTLTEIMEAYSEATDDASSTAGMVALSTVCTRFAGCLQSWNLERRGERVPADYDGLMSLDHQFALKLVKMWMQRTTQASPELGKDSPSGGTSPEVLTTAAALSAALPS